MDGRAVVYVLAHLALILALCMLAPLGIAAVDLVQGLAGPRELAGFVVPVVLSLAAGLALRRRFRASADRVRRREGFAVVVCAWLLMTGVGMLPFVISGTSQSVTDAFFETMSGFTTTGATVFEKVEVIPRGVQFWRCMTQWLGGMGIVVLSVALLQFLGVSGYRLIKAEAPGGVVFERDKPRITDTAKELWRLYLLLSALETVLLMVSGMGPYDAICHTFTTMSTGGFSPHTASIGHFPSPWTQWIVIVFMFLAGTNFVLHAQFLRSGPGPVVRNAEFRLYALVMAAAVLLGLLTIAPPGNFELHLRETAFHVVSIGTTTGYATADYDQWPHAMRLVLVLLMIAGGCMGSTGGGVKMARMLIYAKVAVRELHRLIYPRGVRPIRVGQKVLDPASVSNILAFGFVFAAAFVVGVLAMALSGYDLESSAAASAAALSNIGPALGQLGPTCHWGHLPDVTKWVMALLMLLGRLELFSVLVLATSWAWRR